MRLFRTLSLLNNISDSKASEKLSDANKTDEGVLEVR